MGDAVQKPSGGFLSGLSAVEIVVGEEVVALVVEVVQSAAEGVARRQGQRALVLLYARGVGASVEDAEVDAVALVLVAGVGEACHGAPVFHGKAVGDVGAHGQVAAGQAREGVAVDVVGAVRVADGDAVGVAGSVVLCAEAVLLDAEACDVVGVDAEGALVAGAHDEVGVEDGGEARVEGVDAVPVVAEASVADEEGPCRAAVVVCEDAFMEARERATFHEFVGAGVDAAVAAVVVAERGGLEAGGVGGDADAARRHVGGRPVGAEVAADEADAVHMVEVGVLVEGGGSEVAVVDGEGAVAEAAVVGGLLARGGVVVGVVQCVHGLGAVAEGGVGGVDDAAGGAPVVGSPQGQGALGVLYRRAVLQLHIALGVVAVDGVLVRGTVAPDFDAGPHGVAIASHGAAIQNEFRSDGDNGFRVFVALDFARYGNHGVGIDDETIGDGITGDGCGGDAKVEFFRNGIVVVTPVAESEGDGCLWGEAGKWHFIIQYGPVARS